MGKSVITNFTKIIRSKRKQVLQSYSNAFVKFVLEFHRGKRSIQNFRFHEILTAGPYKMGELRNVDAKELVWNPASLSDISDQSFGLFLTTRKFTFTR